MAMSSDLAGRLRWAAHDPRYGLLYSLLMDAAEELERLKAVEENPLMVVDEDGRVSLAPVDETEQQPDYTSIYRRVEAEVAAGTFQPRGIERSGGPCEIVDCETIDGRTTLILEQVEAEHVG